MTELAGINVLISGTNTGDWECQTALSEDIAFLERKYVVCGRGSTKAKDGTVRAYSDAKDFNPVQVTTEIDPTSDFVGQVKPGLKVDVTHTAAINADGLLVDGDADVPITRRIRIQWGPKGSLSGWMTEATTAGHFEAIELQSCYAPKRAFSNTMLLRDAYYCAKEPLKVLREQPTDFIDRHDKKHKKTAGGNEKIVYTPTKGTIPAGVIFRADAHRPHAREEFREKTSSFDDEEDPPGKRDSYVLTTVSYKNKLLQGWVSICTNGEWHATPMSASAIVRAAGGGTIKLPPVVSEYSHGDAGKMLMLIWGVTAAGIVGFVLLMELVLLVVE